MDPVILTRGDHSLSRKLISREAIKVLYRIYNHGFRSCLVGGSVRDLLLGQTPKDFDVATDARPGEIRKLFRNSRVIGRRFKLVHVFFRENRIIEVSTFRRDSGEPPAHLTDKQKQDWTNNTFGSPQEDALRRDFTINALYYDISDYSIVDFTGGLQDLRQRIIRVIGDPFERFIEDPVRIIRGLDYSARLNFTLESETERAVRHLQNELLQSAPARLTEELLEIFRYGFSYRTARLFFRYDIFKVLYPKLHSVPETLRERWFQVLNRLDTIVYRKSGRPSDILIFFILFFPEIMVSIKNWNPSEAMRVAGELVNHNGIVTFPRRYHHALQQILVAISRMQNPPTTMKLRRIIQRQYFPDVLEVMSCLAEAFPDLVKHYHRWHELYSSYKKTGKLSKPAFRKKKVRR